MPGQPVHHGHGGTRVGSGLWSISIDGADCMNQVRRYVSLLVGNLTGPLVLPSGHFPDASYAVGQEEFVPTFGQVAQVRMHVPQTGNCKLPVPINAACACGNRSAAAHLALFQNQSLVRLSLSRTRIGVGDVLDRDGLRQQEWKRKQHLFQWEEPDRDRSPDIDLLARGRKFTVGLVDLVENHVVGILIAGEEIIASGINAEVARNLALC